MLLHLDVHGTILVVVMFMSRSVGRVAEHDRLRSGFVQLHSVRYLCAACGARGAARVARRQSVRVGEAVAHVHAPAASSCRLLCMRYSFLSLIHI